MSRIECRRWVLLCIGFFILTLHPLAACEKGPFPIPEIASPAAGRTSASFQVEATFRVHKRGQAGQQTQVLDPCNLPEKTKNFLADEFSRLGSQVPPSDQPVRNIVAIRRLEYLATEVEDLFAFILRVDSNGIPRGTAVLEQLLIDKRGNILWGKDMDPYGFLLGWARKDDKKNALLVDIITEVPGRHSLDQTGRIETYEYADGKLNKIGSRQADLNRYWNP